MSEPGQIERALTSLNDVVTELAVGLAAGDTVTKGWAYTVAETLAEHTRTLGGTPEITVEVLDGWKDEQ
jgi:hypothetical protein